MSLTLPAPVRAYFEDEANSDLAALSAVFAADAVVLDEGQSHKGIEAIKAWRAAAKTKYSYSAVPTNAVEEAGRLLVTATVTGNFPGSPVTLDYAFTVIDGYVTALEIH